MSEKIPKKYREEPGAFDSTITKDHYTITGEHPEDRIRRDKEYVTRLKTHMNSIVEHLVNSLRLNYVGEDHLINYIFSENREIDFEEYLNEVYLNYEDLIK